MWNPTLHGQKAGSSHIQLSEDSELHIKQEDAKRFFSKFCWCDWIVFSFVAGFENMDSFYSATASSKAVSIWHPVTQKQRSIKTHTKDSGLCTVASRWALWPWFFGCFFVAVFETDFLLSYFIWTLQCVITKTKNIYIQLYRYTRLNLSWMIQDEFCFFIPWLSNSEVLSFRGFSAEKTMMATVAEGSAVCQPADGNQSASTKIARLSPNR